MHSPLAIAGKTSRLTETQNCEIQRCILKTIQFNETIFRGISNVNILLGGLMFLISYPLGRRITPKGGIYGNESIHLCFQGFQVQKREGMQRFFL